MNRSNIYNRLIPRDILPRDDAYHGSKKYIASEWWYFEAFFNNNYSAVVSFTTSFKNLIAFPTIELYRYGELEVRAIKRYPIHDFQISKHFPLVKLFDNKIIEFDQERFNDRGEWVYNVSMKIEDHKINLKFVGITKGWKFEWDGESWIVALPKASVTGELLVHGNRIPVSGIGYHDHNWFSNLSTIVNTWGWYWGKITGKTLIVTWANIVKKSSKGELLAVVNQDNKGYFTINPENIHFKPDKFIRNYGRKMPTSFTLQIDEVVDNIPIHIDVKMVVKNIHRRYKRMLIAPYWRYHVEATGIISLGSYKEIVNNIQIMEFFRVI